MLGVMNRQGKNVPQTVEHRPVGMQADHPVLDGDAVDEGLLVVEEVSVRHPQLVGDAVVQRQIQRNLRVGEAFVPPCLLEVHGQGVVLQKEKNNTL